MSNTVTHSNLLKHSITRLVQQWLVWCIFSYWSLKNDTCMEVVYSKYNSLHGP